MTIYILRHKNKDFSGSLFGVEFANGRGSTSSTFDKKRCIDVGCKDITQQYRASQAAKKKKDEAKAVKEEKAADKKKAEADKKKEKVETPAAKDEEEEKDPAIAPAADKEEIPAPTEKK